MSAAERRRFEVGETKEAVAERDEWTCRVCGAPVTPANMQLAHRVPQSKINVRAYGARRIHHPLNMVLACSLECNNAVQLSNDPVAERALMAEIDRAITQE